MQQQRLTALALALALTPALAPALAPDHHLALVAFPSSYHNRESNANSESESK